MEYVYVTSKLMACVYVTSKLMEYVYVTSKLMEYVYVTSINTIKKNNAIEHPFNWGMANCAARPL